MVKRYDHSPTGSVETDQYGEFVLAYDYDALVAQTASLKYSIRVAQSRIDRGYERIRELEAENARLNMEMTAYREKLTPADAAAMVAVINALYAEKTGLPSSDGAEPG